MKCRFCGEEKPTGGPTQKECYRCWEIEHMLRSVPITVLNSILKESNFAPTERSDWRMYKKVTLNQARPYTPGEDMTSIFVSKNVTPELGGMIVRGGLKKKSKWYVTKEFFEAHYGEAV